MLAYNLAFMGQVDEILKLPNLEYERRRPEKTVLYQVIQNHYPKAIKNHFTNKKAPFFIEKEFNNFLKCGILAEGFMRIQCPHCNNNRLVAFSCKGRICPSCGARRMIDTADHLVNNVVPFIRVRQWVMTF